ncbi:MAG: 2-C-methyl-D-erythritol 4-phosphate cytidylyltransferase [Gammaproteobacteria bacterium]|nr:MAG: 2-C-methyl-D-erythritol 4-phosphate cytidylyltransferase [Gammaproteobacteria bacterium]
MKDERCWAVVPAAGVGRRMGGNVPKQYLELAGEAILVRTMKRLASCPGISGLFLGVSAADSYWQEMSFSAPWLKSVCNGGYERSDTVSRILDDMAGMVEQNDWVLVHDAVRPCISHKDIQQLMELATQTDGGLLGLPITDTVKLADDENKVKKTVPRQGLWRAQTPQMFRYGELRQALLSAKNNGLIVTDEASAMEYAGFHPLMVQGCPENIKITVAGDLQSAEVFFSGSGVRELT